MDLAWTTQDLQVVYEGSEEYMHSDQVVYIKLDATAKAEPALKGYSRTG